MSIRNKINGFRSFSHFGNRWQLTFNHLFFPGEPVSVYNVGIHRIHADRIAGDAIGIREIHASTMYTRYTEQFLLDHPIRLLDLGGNAGSFPFLFAGRKAGFEKIVAVELNPKTYVRMRFNLESNLDCEVMPLNAAVCGLPREIVVRLGRGGGADNIYKSADGPTGEMREYKVQGLTLDALVERHFGAGVVDVCKMDVEGAEFEIFENPGHGSAGRIRYLIMEIHGEDQPRIANLLSVIKGLGFERMTPKIAGGDETIKAFRNTRLPEGGR